MPRKPKVEVSKEDIDEVNKGTKTVQDIQVDPKYTGITYQSAYNQVKKGKLQVDYEKVEGDVTTPLQEGQLPDEIPTPEQPQVDYHAITKGFWSMVDMSLQMFCSFTKKFEYEKLEEKDIDELSTMTENKLGKFLSEHQSLDIMATIGFVSMKFGTRLHVKKKEDKKDKKLTQEEINEVIKDAKGELDKNTSQEKKEDTTLTSTSINV